MNGKWQQMTGKRQKNYKTDFYFVELRFVRDIFFFFLSCKFFWLLLFVSESVANIVMHSLHTIGKTKFIEYIRSREYNAILLQPEIVTSLDKWGRKGGVREGCRQVLDQCCLAKDYIISYTFV